MNIFKSIAKGVTTGLNHINLAFIMLMFLLLFTVLFGVAIWSWFGDTIGHSVMLEKILLGYDHDIVQDLIRNETSAYQIIIKLAIGLIGLYIIFSPFHSAGVMGSLVKGQDTLASFLVEGATYYGKFLKISAIILILHILLLIVLGFIASMVIGYGLENFLSEVPILWILLCIAIVYILLTILIISISVVAKFRILQQEIGPIKAFKLGLKNVLKNILYYISIGVIFILASILLSILFNWLLNCIVEKNLILVLIALFLQLVILYIRNIMRLVYFGTLQG